MLFKDFIKLFKWEFNGVQQIKILNVRGEEVTEVLKSNKSKAFEVAKVEEFYCKDNILYIVVST